MPDDFICKVVRCDTLGFERRDWRNFLNSVTKSKSTVLHQKRPLRTKQKKKPYGIRSTGVYRVAKDHMYTEQEKLFYSKHSSWMYANPKMNFLPPPFGKHDSKRSQQLIGVQFPTTRDTALPATRILKYDSGTFNRPYYYWNWATAELVANHYFSEKLWFKSYEELCATKYVDGHNEAMVRAKWGDVLACKLTIFSDTMLMRLLSQIRAINVYNRLKQQAYENGEKEKFDAKTKIPIQFYSQDKAKIREYEEQEQSDDFHQGLTSKNSKEMQYSKFLKLLKSDFKGEIIDISPDEVFTWVNLAADLTHETSILFYVNFFLKHYDSIIKKLKDSNKMHLLIDVFRCVPVKYREPLIFNKIKNQPEILSYYIVSLMERENFEADDELLMSLVTGQHPFAPKIRQKSGAEKSLSQLAIEKHAFSAYIPLEDNALKVHKIIAIFDYKACLTKTLIAAVEEHNFDAVKACVQFQPRALYYVDHLKDTALLHAVFHGDVQITRFLLKTAGGQVVNYKQMRGSSSKTYDHELALLHYNNLRNNRFDDIEMWLDFDSDFINHISPQDPPYSTLYVDNENSVRQYRVSKILVSIRKNDPNNFLAACGLLQSMLSNAPSKFDDLTTLLSRIDNTALTLTNIKIICEGNATSSINEVALKLLASFHKNYNLPQFTNIQKHIGRLLKKDIHLNTASQFAVLGLFADNKPSLSDATLAFIIEYTTQYPTLSQTLYNLALKAIKDGNAAMLEQLILAYPESVDARDNNQETLLQWAVYYNRLDCAKVINRYAKDQQNKRSHISKYDLNYYGQISQKIQALFFIKDYAAIWRWIDYEKDFINNIVNKNYLNICLSKSLVLIIQYQNNLKDFEDNCKKFSKESGTKIFEILALYYDKQIQLTPFIFSFILEHYKELSPQHLLAALLINAVKRSDIVTIKQLILAAPDCANWTDSKYETPLQWAAFQGELEIVKLFEQSGKVTTKFSLSSEKLNYYDNVALYLQHTFNNFKNVGHSAPGSDVYKIIQWLQHVPDIGRNAVHKTYGSVPIMEWLNANMPDKFVEKLYELSAMKRHTPQKYKEFCVLFITLKNENIQLTPKLYEVFVKKSASCLHEVNTADINKLKDFLLFHTVSNNTSWNQYNKFQFPHSGNPVFKVFLKFCVDNHFEISSENLYRLSLFKDSQQFNYLLDMANTVQQHYHMNNAQFNQLLTVISSLPSIDKKLQSNFQLMFDFNLHKRRNCQTFISLIGQHQLIETLQILVKYQMQVHSNFIGRLVAEYSNNQPRHDISDHIKWADDYLDWRRFHKGIYHGKRGVQDIKHYLKAIVENSADTKQETEKMLTGGKSTWTNHQYATINFQRQHSRLSFFKHSGIIDKKIHTNFQHAPKHVLALIWFMALKLCRGAVPFLFTTAHNPENSNVNRGPRM